MIIGHLTKREIAVDIEFITEPRRKGPEEVQTKDAVRMLQETKRCCLIDTLSWKPC